MSCAFGGFEVDLAEMDGSYIRMLGSYTLMITWAPDDHAYLITSNDLMGVSRGMILGKRIEWTYMVYTETCEIVDRLGAGGSLAIIPITKHRRAYNLASKVNHECWEL